MFTPYDNHRSSKAWTMVALLIPLLIWLSFTEQESAYLVNTEFTNGIIEHVSSVAGKHGVVNHYARVSLPNGKTMMIPVNKPVPKVNDKVPLLLHRYSNGKQRYQFDKEQWILSVPAR